MKVGDMVKYSPHEYNDRLGTHGIVLQSIDDTYAIVEVLWDTDYTEEVFSDELEVINAAR